MAPGARSKFGVPRFELDIFRKQILGNYAPFPPWLTRLWNYAPFPPSLRPWATVTKSTVRWRINASFHPVHNETTWLTAVNSHCCITYQVRLFSTVTWGKTPSCITSSEHLKICCHVIVTQWRPIVQQSAPEFGNLPLQAIRADLSELQVHHCMTS